MPATIADLRAKVSIDGAAQAKKDLSDLKGKSGASGGGILGLADGFKSGLGAVTGFITGFEGFKLAGDALGFVKDQLLDVIQAGMTQQQIEAQTAAVIKSTGGAAGFTTEQISNYADSMAQLTGISNDTIQSSENVLLTFRDIGHNVFPQAEQAILDVSVAMHEDLQSATVQVGKALNDPLTGMTALQRIGVTFSESQKTVIKRLVDTGQTAKAQQLIIKELDAEFGNSAEAAGKTLPGKLAILNEKWDEAKEKIAGAVIPILSNLVDKYVMPLADWLGKQLPGAIQITTNFLNNELVPAVNAVMNSPFVKTVEGWAQSLASKLDPQLTQNTPTASDKTVKAFKKVSDQATGTGNTLSGPFVAKIQVSINKLDNLTDAMDGGHTNTKNIGVSPAILKVNKNLALMDKALDDNAKHVDNNKNQIPAWEVALEGASGGWDQLRTHIADVINTLGGFKDAVSSSFASSASVQVGGLFGMGSNFINWGKGVKGDWSGIWDSLTGIVNAGIHTVQGVVSSGLDAVGAISSGKWDKVKQDWERAEKQVTQDVEQFVKGVQKTLSGLPSWLQGAGGAIHLPGKASGGPISGPFIGAERGPELLMTPGLYNAPPGSYVYNAQQTQQMLNGKGGGMGQRGNTYNTYVYPQQANIDTAELARIQHRRDLLNGMYS